MDKAGASIIAEIRGQDGQRVRGHGLRQWYELMGKDVVIGTSAVPRSQVKRPA